MNSLVFAFFYINRGIYIYIYNETWGGVRRTRDREARIVEEKGNV